MDNELSRQDEKVYQKICTKFTENHWSVYIELDKDWGWVILADKKFKEFGTILRRIKPYRLNSLSDFQRAIKLQERFRPQLIEIIPYKVFLGNKIHLPNLDNNLSFLSEANFEEWRKYFKRQNISLKTSSIDEAIN